MNTIAVPPAVASKASRSFLRVSPPRSQASTPVDTAPTAAPSVGVKMPV